MRCLIRFTGAQGATERALDKPELTLGRATHNDIELPGLLVALEHARLRLTGPGQYHVISTSVTGVEFRGQPGQRDFAVKPGDRFGIAGHELAVLPPAGGYDLVLSVQLKDDARPLPRPAATLDLGAAGLRLRRPAVIGALIVLALGLIVPLASRALGVHAPRPLALLSDRAWQPGTPMSFAHAHFAGDCGVCHQQMFSAVADSACAGCHAKVAHHIEPPLPNHPDPVTGCSTCHREHRGEHGITARAPALCADCHGRPDKFGVSIAAVRDFDHHPEFSLWLPQRQADGSTREARTPIGPGVKDATGLAFPHELHVAKAGVRGPNGVQVLACASCHKADQGRVGFLPIRFEDNCKSCHQLSVVIGGKESELPHGDSDAVRRILEGLAQGGQYTAQAPAAAANFDLRQRAGESAERAAAPAREDLIADVFEFRVCARCHQTERTAEGNPRVRPPHLRSWYFAGASFTHARHDALDCTGCHAVTQSKSGDDLALPGIDSCRGCHTDADASHGVPTPCASCHRFHRAVPAAAVANAAKP